MKVEKLKLIFQSGGGSKSLELDNEPIFLGSASQCQINFGSNNPALKGIIQYFIDHQNNRKVLISSLDPQLKLHFKGKTFDQLLLNEEEIYNLRIDQISIFNEKFYEDGELIPQDIIEANESAVSVQDLPSLPAYKLPETFMSFKKKSEEVIPGPVVEEKSSKESSHIQTVYREEGSEDKTLIFSTIFNEESFEPRTEVPFLNKEYDFSEYIDPSDETIQKLPSKDITVPSKGMSIQIIHMNNGVVLNEQYFPMSEKRIYLSRKGTGKKTFQVHDLEDVTKEFIYIKNGHAFVDSLEGFKFQKYHPEVGLVDVDDNTYELEYENERLIFTKGTSQVIVRMTSTPPKLTGVDFFTVDDMLVKCVVGLWAVVSIPVIMLMLFVNINLEPVKPQKEVVVIYKRKKPTEEVKVVEKVQEASEAPQKSEESKKPEPSVTENKVQKNVKKVAKTKVVTKDMKKVQRKKTKKVAKKVAPVKAQKPKSYSFNTASMMKSVLSKPSSTVESVDKVNSSFNEVIGKNKFKMQKGVKNLDANRNKVAKYGSGDVKGLKTSFGVRGISSKTKTQTSYQKTSTKILGAVDPELIRKLLREYIPHFRHCYQKELLRNPDLNGIFDLDFEINPSGKGQNLKISNSKGKFTTQGMGCLKTVIKKIRFPKPRGGGTVDVVQPLNFYSQTL